MTPPTADRLWLRSLKWSLTISVPICLLMAVDTIFTPAEQSGVMPDFFFYLGMIIYLAQSYIVGIYHGNGNVICAWGGLANSLVIWAAVHWVFRIRMRRVEKRS